MKLDNSKNQIRWVILLLAIAVILPTVCLLFFMTQAVKNERLAMRQRMVDFYTKKINEVLPGPSEMLELYTPPVMASFEVVGFELWKLELTDASINDLLFSQASNMSSMETFVVYDPNGVMVHPVLEGVDTLPARFDEIAAKAYEFEFQDVNVPAAIEEYAKISKESKDERIIFAADIAKVRCLKKIGNKKEAVELATKLSYLESETIPNQLAGDILRARVMLARLLDAKTFKSNYDIINNLIYKTLSPQAHFPSDTRVWTLSSIKEFVPPIIHEANGYSMTGIENVITMEDMAVSAANIYPNPQAFGDWPERTYRQIQSDPLLYGVYFSTGGNHFLKVLSKGSVELKLTGAMRSIADEMVFCKVFDDQGKLVATHWDSTAVQLPKFQSGTAYSVVYEPSGEKFYEINRGENHPGWKIVFYFHNGVFSNAAKRLKLTYIWTAALLTSLILTVSGFAGKSILKQAKLNTLKNDFIATVTHELKTPLASMRVLVDTLLEGSYNDQRQAVEYLQLISKENRRLTGLIDNFLTFSRMERNKQAFDIIDCPAEDIVNDAAAAVKTKFTEKNCKFSVTIGDDVASILADKDAMVTVLVNLLDNACKYSGDKKEIELSVYNENENVCFTVKDNGIGMSPKVQKKIFERFYQADSKLSRSAEGCGLGLSIVKFIVDAHNGTINIESEPGKGSTFKIWIPI